jgi:hypothetical protein
MADSKKTTAPGGYVTISEAIRLSGVARSTFYEDLRSGKISFSTLNFRGKEKKFVQVVDLTRVYGALVPGMQNEQKAEHIEQPRTNEKQSQTDFALAIELGKAQARIEGMENLISELKRARETAEQDKENAFRLLKEQMETVKLLEARIPAKEEKKRGLFARLFRRKAT